MRAPCMKKRFVFLLQRFPLVVQEREYIRVRGFHLVLSENRGTRTLSKMSWGLPIFRETLRPNQPLPGQQWAFHTCLQAKEESSDWSL
jgi:hypothetical protein